MRKNKNIIYILINFSIYMEIIGCEQEGESCDEFGYSYYEKEKNDSPEIATDIPKEKSNSCGICGYTYEKYCGEIIGEIGKCIENKTQYDNEDWFNIYLDDSIYYQSEIEFNSYIRGNLGLPIKQNTPLPKLSIIQKENMEPIVTSADENTDGEPTCTIDNSFYNCILKFGSEPPGWYFIKIEICQEKNFCCNGNMEWDYIMYML